jgi:hypothetical protein
MDTNFEEINLKANLASPALTGTPTAPTPTAGDNTTQVATTEFVNSEISNDVGVANSSLVKTALNASGSAPIYACRAWVNFNGTDTVAIRASGNVSSITDYGPGNYGVNFTTAMQDANYVAVCNAANPESLVAAQVNGSNRALTSCQLYPLAADALYAEVAIFR